MEVNPAAYKLFGVTRKKLINKSIADFLQSPLDWKQVRERAEIQIRQPKGEIKTVEYSQVKDLLPRYNLLVLRDITNFQREAAAELNLHHQRVELFAELPSKFVNLYN